MNFLEQIEQHRSDFSKTEQKVYQYVINHIDTLETYTITKIADLSHTSTAAVQRFCQTLGYRGFKDFRYDAIDYLHHHHRKESLDPLDDMTDNYISLARQFKNVDRNKVSQLIQAILNRQRVHIFGIYYSSLPARFLHMGLQDLRIPSYFAGDLNSGAHLTNIIREEDTLIMFSLSGDMGNYRAALAALQHNMPQNSYLITLNNHSQIDKFFRQTIVLPGSAINRQSIINPQSISSIFVEILLNLIHQEMR
ncbi:MurR/RpiR family transcriptional regulator [Streptococcus tangpeifui]|uniref:MurR/RpiR family transcriptional regulator n=1 Tax=Streptococcus tangpeifui TaxID=2709400 RepID=UPI0013ED2DBE|nr:MULTISPECIES: MurR/RpiR family transcriptional regulator [unclassified Streptococcus]